MRFLHTAMAVVAAAVLSIPATAHAADSGSGLAAKVVTASDVGTLAASCPSGNWCVWRYPNPSTNTNRYSWLGSDGDYRNNHWDDGKTVDNTPSAAFNASNQGNDVGFYAGYNYTNTSVHPFFWCFPPGSGIADLRQADFDNAGSSHRFVTSC